MATGKHPFRRPTAVETLAAILNDEPPPLNEPFAWIVERCLAKRPAERYGSTTDLAHDLRRASVGPALLPVRTDKSVGATPTRLWWLVVIVIAPLLFVIAVVTLRRPKKPGDPFQVAVPTPEIAQIAKNEVALPISLSPDGRSLAIYGMNADGISAIWVHDLRTGAVRQVAENPYSLGWSSDGKALAYFSEGKLKTVPVDGGPARIVCDARPESTPSWHGDTILYTQYSAGIGIFRVNAAGGKPELLVGIDPKDAGFAWWPQFLPDGKHFLYLMILQHGENAEVDHELRIGSLDGGPPKRVSMKIDSRAVYANGQLLYVRDGTLLAQPFDPDKARVTGEPKPIIDGLYYFRNTGLAAFTVSDNGVLAWRVTGGPSRLVWMDRTGIETGFIASAPFGGDGRLSPDGHRYAVSIVDPKQGVGDIWVYNLDRDSSERETFTTLDDKAPVWAPDGRTIYYRSDCCGPPDILKLTPGVDAGTIVYRGPGVEEPQDVSSDGKWLLFSDHRQAGAADIHVLPLIPPGPPHPFVKTRFNEYNPRFSPDGRWVVYESNISGKPEIYVKAFEGAGPSTRVSKDGGTRPRWRQDGKELFFFAPGSRIMSVAMNGGEAAAAPRMLFQAPDAVDFEPAHDGSRFIVQLEEHTSNPPVHLLINWPARLRAEN
jgi:Tol biopolymer transport system component